MTAKIERFSDEDLLVLERMRARAKNNDRAFPLSRYATELALLDRLISGTPPTGSAPAVGAPPDRKEFEERVRSAVREACDSFIRFKVHPDDIGAIADYVARQLASATLVVGLPDHIPAGEPITATTLDALEYYGCSSGTSAPPIVRDAIVRVTQELRRRRATDERLSTAEFAQRHVEDIADRVAKQLAGAAPQRSAISGTLSEVATTLAEAATTLDAIRSAAPDRIALPARKEWDSAPHDRGDPTDATGTSEYVDGWNDALDEVESSEKRSPTGGDRTRQTDRLVDLAIRIRDRRLSVRTSLDREDRALFDELSEAVDLYRKTPRSQP